VFLLFYHKKKNLKEGMPHENTIDAFGETVGIAWNISNTHDG
jgi:hypothetical protein